MAVINSLGLAVSIVINGQDVAEYTDPDPEPDLARKYPGAEVINKYIESEDHIKYAVSVKVLPNHRWLLNDENNSLKFTTSIDGVLRDVTCTDSDDCNNGELSITISGVRNEPGTINNFKFDSIKPVAEANRVVIDKDLERAKELGLIRIEISRGIKLGTCPTKFGEQSEEKPDLKFAKKALILLGRAISHGTTLSPATEDEIEVNTVTFEPVDETPYAVFNFKYRSRCDLRNEMIVPRTPSPEASIVVEDLSIKELQRLARERLAQLKEETSSVKKDSPGVKREFDDVSEQPAIRPRKTWRTEKATVTVDLTDD